MAFKSIVIPVAAGLSFFASGGAFASSCDGYPYSGGEIYVEAVDGGTKVLSTGTATVDFDDQDDVLEATMEAEMEAKAKISHFLNEEIQSDVSIESATTKIVSQQKSEGGESKQVSKEKMKTTLKRLANSSQSLLRGVIKLADCYTPGKLVMVTVGLKPETIANAERTAGAISESMERQGSSYPGTGTRSSSGSKASKQDSGVKGYSNTRRLDDF